MEANKNIFASSFTLIIILIILYLYMFNPILLSLNEMGTIKLLYPLALIFFLSKKNFSLFTVYPKESLIFLLLALFTLIRAGFGGDITLTRVMIVSFIENIIIANAIVFLIVKYLPKFDLRTLIIYTSFVGSLITLACILNPSMNIYIKTQIIVTSNLMEEMDFRGFGIAESLTFSYGVLQGIAASLCLLDMHKKKYYMFFIPLLLISVMFNARTGFIPPIVTLVFLALSKGGKKTVFMVMFISLLLFSSIGQLAFFQNNEETVEWSMDFFTQASDFIYGTDKAHFNTIETLAYEMQVLPENTVEWIVGSGKHVYLERGSSTDVGYYLQLKYGGMVFVAMLFSLFYIMISRINKYKEYRWFLFIFIVVTLVCNFKGDFIPNSGGFRLFCLIYAYMVISALPSIAGIRQINNNNFRTTHI